MLHEEKEDENDGTEDDMEVRSTVQEEEEYEDDVDYTERFTLRMEAGWNPHATSLWRGTHDWDRTVEMKFDGEYLGEILDQFKTFMKACGFSYITKLTATSVTGEEYESEEDM